MNLLLKYVVVYGVVFFLLDIARWVSEKRSVEKASASCVSLLLLYDLRWKKIRFVIVGLVLLVSFGGGVYLILIEQAESALLGVFTALVGWLVGGMILDKWK